MAGSERVSGYSVCGNVLVQRRKRYEVDDVVRQPDGFAEVHGPRDFFRIESATAREVPKCAKKGACLTNPSVLSLSAYIRVVRAASRMFEIDEHLYLRTWLL